MSFPCFAFPVLCWVGLPCKRCWLGPLYLSAGGKNQMAQDMCNGEEMVSEEFVVDDIPVALSPE